MTWTFSINKVFAVVALVIFILAALAFSGSLQMNGHVLLACGLAAIAAAMVV